MQEIIWIQPARKVLQLAWLWRPAEVAVVAILDLMQLHRPSTIRKEAHPCLRGAIGIVGCRNLGCFQFPWGSVDGGLQQIVLE